MFKTVKFEDNQSKYLNLKKKHDHNIIYSRILKNLYDDLENNGNEYDAEDDIDSAINYTNEDRKKYLRMKNMLNEIRISGKGNTICDDEQFYLDIREIHLKYWAIELYRSTIIMKIGKRFKILNIKRDIIYDVMLGIFLLKNYIYKDNIKFYYYDNKLIEILDNKSLYIPEYLNEIDPCLSPEEKEQRLRRYSNNIKYNNNLYKKLKLLNLLDEYDYIKVDETNENEKELESILNKMDSMFKHLEYFNVDNILLGNDNDDFEPKCYTYLSDLVEPKINESEDLDNYLNNISPENIVLKYFSHGIYKEMNFKEKKNSKYDNIFDSIPHRYAYGISGLHKYDENRSEYGKVFDKLYDKMCLNADEDKKNLLNDVDYNYVYCIYYNELTCDIYMFLVENVNYIMLKSSMDNISEISLIEKIDLTQFDVYNKKHDIFISLKDKKFKNKVELEKNIYALNFLLDEKNNSELLSLLFKNIKK